MSLIAKAGLLLGGIFALFALAWMLFLPVVAERELRAVTGFDFHVAVLSANPFTGRVVVRGLTARNPPGYPEPDFAEVRAVRADVRVFSWLFSDQIVIDELDVDISKVELVRQHDGKTNAGDFMAAVSGGGANSAPRATERFLVRRLHLNFDRLVVADYSGSKLDERTYNLHIDETFNDVSDTRQLLVPAVVQRLHSFGLHHDVARLLPGEFGKALAGAVGSAATVGAKVKDATVKTGSLIEGVLDKLEQKPNP